MTHSRKRLKRNEASIGSLGGNIGFKLYTKTKKSILACVFRCCPIVMKVMKSKRTEYRPIKAIIGFPLGLLYGFVLHRIVLQQLKLEPFTNAALGYFLSLFAGVGFAFSSQVRCICCLVIPTFAGRTGRAYISTFLITFVINGPINNLMSNAHESLRVINCVMSLSVNHTVERFKLMFAPIKEVVGEFTSSGEKIQTDSKAVDKSYKPINEEVNDEEELKQSIAETNQLDDEVGGDSRVDVVKKKFRNYKKGTFGGLSEAKYGIKSEMRCESIFTKGVKGCRDSFGKAYDRCLSAIPIIGYLLCWPMKLTFICDIASSMMSSSRSCDSKNGLTPGFGESVDTAEGVANEFDKGFQVKMQYKLVLADEEVDQLTPGDVGRALENKITNRRQNLEFWMMLINRLMAFMILQVFSQSRKYCDQYLRHIEFDNIYTTSYFRHIDARRKKQEKRTLLPLKKSEKLELADPFAVKLTRGEKGVIVLNTLRLIGEVTTISMIILFDRVFYEMLLLIQRHSHVEFKQTGTHRVSLEIYGEGFMGKVMRKILKGFDKKRSLDSITSTAECLPIPSKLENFYIIRIYVIFFIIFLLMFFESYTMRFRRVICKFFYPKREKKRVLFLYNDRLKKRKSYLHYMRRRIRKLARDQAIAIDTGVFQGLRLLYPKYHSILSKLGLGKSKCLICNEVQSKKNIFIQCSEDCSYHYCPECWKDIKERCYACIPDDEDDSELSEDEMSN